MQTGSVGQGSASWVDVAAAAGERRSLPEIVAIGVSHHQSSLQRKKADSLRWLEWAGLLAGLGCWGWAGPQFFYEWCRQTPFSSVWLVIQPHRRTRIAGRWTEKTRPRTADIQLRDVRPPTYINFSL